MLKRLNIRNYALIDAIEIDFAEGLTIITGETGAGKSILLGALGLIMGERADTKIFYNDTEKCIVEGIFDVSAYDLQPFFTEHELDYDTEVVIRRELSPAGKSRAFVNDTPVNNQVLQRLTEALVDLHQQFDTLDIHNVNFQLRMIDALADNQEPLKAYQTDYRAYSADKKRLQLLIERQENAAKEVDFLRFQVDELQSAELIADEQETAEQELQRLTAADDIKRIYGAAYNHLADGEQNIIGQLRELIRSMSSTRRFSADLQSISNRLESTVVELQEVAKDCERIQDNTENDPQRAYEVQERLNLLYKLQKKHGVSSVTELLTIEDDLVRQLSGFTDVGEEITWLEKDLKAREKTLRTKATALSERRKAVTKGFEEKVTVMLTQLSMPDARLRVDVNPTEALTPTGTDDVAFLFASNVGSRYQAIKDVASGGELSRLNLCTKSIVADAIPLPTLIFDEIDAGISGDVSMQMGHILRELSNRHQVVSITHTPQVAARAQCHYFVYKQIKDNRTATSIRRLTDDERVRAIAVMLSGNPPSDSALKTAQELVFATV
jgi:DNA repair protein RecN (Recombination protein N)